MGDLGFMDFYGMSAAPFDKGIPVSRLWRPPQHEEALARLDYAARNRRFAVMTAPPGCGKSTALRALSESLPASEFRFIYVSESNLTPRCLYNSALRELGLGPRFYVNDAKHELHNQISTITKVERRTVVLIIDEAHLVHGSTHRRETLEEVRFLLNSGYDSGSPLSLILSGQPELLPVLASPACEAIAQRIDCRIELSPLPDAASVSDYIRAHLAASGGPGDLFPAQLAGRIASASGGVPRLINRICTACLLYSATRGERIVTEATLSDVLGTEMPGLPCGSVSKKGGRS